MNNAKTAFLLCLALVAWAGNASAAVEPTESDYPFSLEQASEVAQAAWVESMLGPITVEGDE